MGPGGDTVSFYRIFFTYCIQKIGIQSSSVKLIMVVAVDPRIIEKSFIVPGIRIIPHHSSFSWCRHFLKIVEKCSEIWTLAFLLM